MHVKAENYHVLDKPRRNVYTVKNMKTYMHALKISFFLKIIMTSAIPVTML